MKFHLGLFVYLAIVAALIASVCVLGIYGHPSLAVLMVVILILFLASVRIEYTA